MGKRDVFWKSISSEDGHGVRWPSEPHQRDQLAKDMVGSTIVGAAEATLGEVLDRLAGALPVGLSPDGRPRVLEVRGARIDIPSP